MSVVSALRALLYEHVFLLAATLSGGLVAGVLTTQLFLPYLPIAANTGPPFVMRIPWSAVAAFVLSTFLAIVLVLSQCAALVLRLQLGHVLRLGER